MADAAKQRTGGRRRIVAEARALLLYGMLFATVTGVLLALRPAARPGVSHPDERGGPHVPAAAAAAAR